MGHPCGVSMGGLRQPIPGGVVVSQVLLEIAVLLVLILANGVFAMSEAALLAARKSRLQSWAESGNGRARAALALAEEPNAFLATVQIGITLVGVLAGAFGGATLAQQLGDRLDQVPAIEPHGEALAVLLVVVAITYVSLVIGELVPKRLALSRAERIASFVAGPMHRLSVAASPLVRLLALSTDAVLRLTGSGSAADTSVTPEEIRILVQQGTQSGSIEESEQDMIESVLRLDDRDIDTLMTPRRSIVWLDVDDTDDEVRTKIGEARHSRFPVARGDLDEVVGYVHAKDVLHQRLTGRPLDLDAVMRSPLFVPEGMSALRVLGTFRRSGTHVALVVDEYGGIQGMVTNNDLLEHIAGYDDLPGDDEAPMATQRADGSWLLDGLLRIDRLAEIAGIERLPMEGTADYHTVGGLVMAGLGGIPTAGQIFEWENLRFEVVDMDGRRVDKVLLTVLDEPATA